MGENVDTADMKSIQKGVEPPNTIESTASYVELISLFGYPLWSGLHYIVGFNPMEKYAHQTGSFPLLG